MTIARREILENIIDIKSLRGLEIGPLTSPIVRPEDIEGRGQIFYLDHLSKAGLKEKYKDDSSINVEKIVNVDFVCSDGDIVRSVEDKVFDYVIASHVIEHSPNLLKFVEDISSILSPGGLLFLIIPDKRFTFDLKRPETTFGEVLE